MVFIVFVNLSKILISIVEDEKVTITNSNSGENKLCLHTIEPKQGFIHKECFKQFINMYLY